MVAMAQRARGMFQRDETLAARRLNVEAARGIRLRQARRHFEMLEPRMLLSSTLFVTAPGGPTDATHFGNLQAALLVAGTGDTILLQPGFAMGAFNSATLIGTAAAGDTTIHVTQALSAGQVVTIGSTGGTDPLERALVTNVTPTLLGDFLVSLASPLQYGHTNSTINGTNSNTTGATIGIARALTLSADPAVAGPVVLPFNLELWQGVSGITVSNLSLTLSPATSIFIDGDGNTLSKVSVANQVVLTNAHTNSLVNVTVSSRLYVDTGSSGNVFSDSNLKSVQLRSGTHDNAFVRDAIGGLKAFGVGDSNGNDTFQLNTFTGAVTIIGNTTAPTNDMFLNNTFTLAAGKPLFLDGATGTLVQGNTLTASGSAAITVHNSDNVVITGNQVTTTGSRGTGIAAYADVTGSTSVDIRNNVLQSTDGVAVSLGKYDTTANLEVRLQGNDLRNSGTGLFVWGDGDSAGNVDLGGGSTRFGTSLGGNDFTTFTSSDAMHFAIGLFNTSVSFTLHADNNLWKVTDPLAVVADGSHTPDAGGTGVITAVVPAPVPVEELAGTASNLAAVQTGTTSGLLAHFTSTFQHVAADFVVTVTWGDGASTTAAVVANPAGGFDVVGSHQWMANGNFTFAVNVASNGGATVEIDGSATITPRVLAAQGISFTIDKRTAFSGAVATFTDNLGGTVASAYVASVAWSDGLTTVGSVVKNADGSFSILTSRTFSTTGVMVASVSVGTVDGAFYATTSLTATITNKNDKVPGPKPRQLTRLTRMVKHSVEHSRKSLHANSHCHH